MKRLEGKIALVTGASRGIGRAIALRFAEEGADLVVNFLNNHIAAGRVVADIQDRGGSAIAIAADMRQPHDVQEMVRQSLDHFGRLDIAVSNAGIVIDRPFLDSTQEDWSSAIETNLHGFFNLAKSVLPAMKDRQYGRLLVTASCIAEVADFGGNSYSVCAASKGGILALMRPMAAEMAQYGVTVNAVSPGYIATEMLHSIDPAGLESALKLVPMRRYGRPEEIAAAMVFLASDEAAYITGQSLRVNGGLSMG